MTGYVHSRKSRCDCDHLGRSLDLDIRHNFAAEGCTASVIFESKDLRCVKGELTDIAAAVADSPVGHRKADSMTLLRGDRGSEEDIQQGRSSWIKVGFALKEVVMRERR